MTVIYTSFKYDPHLFFQGTCNKTCNGSDCQLMGMNSVNMDANGTFYLETKDSSPYSKPQDTIPFTCMLVF